MSSPSESSATREPGKPGPWMSRAEGRVVAGLLLAIVAIVAYWIHDRRGDWARAESEIDQTDPRWRLHELEADRKSVPDHENSGLHCLAVASLGGKIRVSD